jgi:hypothetical protein
MTSRVGFFASLVWVLFATTCNANSISLVGSLDPNNPDDLLVFPFSLGVPSSLTIQSYGYGGGVNAAGNAISAGGFDTYVSLFAGTGLTAAFLASNDDGACPPGNASPTCHDSTLAIASLAAGPYTLALSVFENFSFAENFGAGTLGDGFIGLGDYFDAASGLTRTSRYAVDITADGLAASPVPEPSAWPVAAGALLILILVNGRRSR